MYVGGASSITITPSGRPAGTDRWRDRVEEWLVAQHRYALPTYRDHVPTTASSKSCTE